MTVTQTTSIKSELCSWSLHWSLSNLPQLSTTLTAPMKSELLTLFIKACECKVINTNEFLPIIDAGHIYRSIGHYKRYIESCIAIISRVCYCCGLFVGSLSSVVVLRSDPIVIVALDKDAIYMAFLDYCGRKIDEYRFYYLCFNILK